MSIKLNLTFILLLFPVVLFSQEKSSVYIHINSKDIKYKLFYFNKEAGSLAISLNVAVDFNLYGRKEPIIIFRYQHKFEKDLIWAEPRLPLKDLKKIKTISMKAFTDSLLQPGKGSAFLRRNHIFLIVHDKKSQFFQKYEVEYRGPTLADPHDLYLEEPKKKN